jgi:hypothetical protein
MLNHSKPILLITLLGIILLGIVYQAEAMTYNYSFFDVPGSDMTYANGINTSGTIVGTYGNPISGYSKKEMNYSYFSYPGSISTSAN